MFLSLTRPRAELTRMYLPSKSNQTGVTCGLPFGMIVARLANALFVVTRSMNSGGIVPRVAVWRRGAGLLKGRTSRAASCLNQVHPCARRVVNARAATGNVARRVDPGGEVILPWPAWAAFPTPFVVAGAPPHS